MFMWHKNAFLYECGNLSQQPQSDRFWGSSNVLNATRYYVTPLFEGLIKENEQLKLEISISIKP